MANGVAVRIRTFKTYKGRKDVVHNSWFRCSNRLLEDPDFFDFSATEILVWIYILSLASQKNSDAVYINFDHAERVCRLKKKDVLSALEKLKGNQIDPAGVTPTLRPRDADVTSTCATEITEITEKRVSGSVEPCSPDQTEISSANQILENIKPEIREGWAKLYPDPDYVPRNLLLMENWCLANPKKKPRSQAGWTKFVIGWLERGWDRHRKGIPSAHIAAVTGGWD